MHYIKDAKKKAEDNNRKLLDQRNFEDASRSDRSCIRATALSLSQRLIHPEKKQGLGAIAIDQSHALLIDHIASALLKIDDIVDFRMSMRGREVAGAVYIQ